MTKFHGDGVDAWMQREVRRHVFRAVVFGLMVSATLAFGIYSR